jgi:ABC-type phosphate transport system substrate-binding protein
MPVSSGGGRRAAHPIWRFHPMSRSTRLVAATLAGAGALSVALAAPALADPPASHRPITIAGVGSDTTQDVMNALANSYNAGQATAYIASWDAFPPGATAPNPNATIVTKPGCAKITRPAGSSAGIAALLNDSSGKCIQFARSSRVKATNGTEDSLGFYAYGRDGVTWAVSPSSPTHVSNSLTAAQLKNIYTCKITNWKNINSSLPSNTIKPYLPQAGSGTRSFFLGAIGVTDAQVGSCVNQNIIENDGRPLKGNANALMPYSIAKWISQREKVGGLPDITGGLALKPINGVSPTVGANPNLSINPAFSTTFLRLIFNVTKNSNPYAYLFNSTGFVCKHQDIIKKYGFITLGSGCGVKF